MYEHILYIIIYVYIYSYIFLYEKFFIKINIHLKLLTYQEIIKLFNIYLREFLSFFLHSFTHALIPIPSRQSLRVLRIIIFYTSIEWRPMYLFIVEFTTTTIETLNANLTFV